MAIMDDIKILNRRVSQRSPINIFKRTTPDISGVNTMSIEHLDTRGDEFRVPLGFIHIGSYHIHRDKGPMVGSTHSTKKHDILIPLNEEAANKVRKYLGFNPYPNNDYENFQPQSSNTNNNTNNGGGTY
tara:strand:- start:2990 stop:3376 length:387 start_codon:yes stop_codon:yes gene_type:complete